MMINTNIDFDLAQFGSYYTITGCGGDLAEWTNGYEKLMSEKGIGKPECWYTFKGKDMNDRYDLAGTVRYPDDLTFLAFPLDGLSIGRLAMFRLAMCDRWFSDIVANNEADMRR